MPRQRKPKLGQNFLSDLSARQRIVDALGDLSASTVLEIGPGHGALTELLAPRAHRLLAIELDRALVPELRFRFRNHPTVEILEADILTVDLPALLTTPRPPQPSEDPPHLPLTTERSDANSTLPGQADTPAPPLSPLVILSEVKNPRLPPLFPERSDPRPTLPGQADAPPHPPFATEPSNPTTHPIHVVGNLPYYITSDILLHLFRTVVAAPGLLSSAILMMQREVAERVASPPGRRDFGLLSATAQMHAIPELLFTLGPAAFTPPPEVDSSVVRLRFHSRFAELAVQPAAFDRFLHQAFAQKRKTLAKNLRIAGFSPASVTAAWPPHLNPQIRAEATSLEDLAALHRSLPQTTTP